MRRPGEHHPLLENHAGERIAPCGQCRILGFGVRDHVAADPDAREVPGEIGDPIEERRRAVTERAASPRSVPNGGKARCTRAYVALFSRAATLWRAGGESGIRRAMRSETNAAKLLLLMEALGRAARGPGRVYLVGGATAVLEGWRKTTVDVDMKLDPEPPGLLSALPRIKDDLEINVELAAPDDFVPPLPGWRERSRSIGRYGSVEFYHYDDYAQALAKIERGHARDVGDVREMIARGLVRTKRLRELFDAIVPKLYRYPAIDPDTFRRRVERAVRGGPSSARRTRPRPRRTK